MQKIVWFSGLIEEWKLLMISCEKIDVDRSGQALRIISYLEHGFTSFYLELTPENVVLVRLSRLLTQNNAKNNNN